MKDTSITILYFETFTHKQIEMRNFTRILHEDIFMFHHFLLIDKSITEINNICELKTTIVDFS